MQKTSHFSTLTLAWKLETAYLCIAFEKIARGVAQPG